MKLTLILCSALAAMLLPVSSQSTENHDAMKLWPNGAPGETERLGPEHDTTKDSDGKVGGTRVIRLGNVSDPTITVYPPPESKANGAAILVCPGGAYQILAMDLEGTEICERLNEMGITAILLKYRVPRRANLEKHAAPLQDAERAMSLIRDHADEWKIDAKRVGVLGFSAGGHLAATLSNHAGERSYPKVDAADELSSRPNFTVLIYPAYLTPENDRTKLAPEVNVTKETPQAFIAMAADDPVHVENALVYAGALVKEKIPVELHIYPTGGHGYGLRKTGQEIATWPDRLEAWLNARGISRKTN